MDKEWLEDDRILTRLNFWKPRNLVSEIWWFTTNGEAFPRISSWLENSAPASFITNILTEDVAPGHVTYEGIVESDEDHALSCAGVDNQFPQILWHRDLLINQEYILTFYLQIIIISEIIK